MSKRFTAQKWIELGLELLATEGPEALTIDELCRASGKTRGSFYFHFDGIEAFLTALANTWLEDWTLTLTSKPPPESERLDRLNLIAGRTDLDLESGMRKLAAREALVSDIVRTADQERVSWLAESYKASGKYNPEEAAALARIEYAAFIGFRMIEPDLSASEARNLYDHFLEFTERV